MAMSKRAICPPPRQGNPAPGGLYRRMPRTSSLRWMPARQPAAVGLQGAAAWGTLQAVRGGMLDGDADAAPGESPAQVGQAALPTYRCAARRA